MSFLSVCNLKKNYAGVNVLDIPALDVEKGAITAVIGTNGAGKSTLLSIIGGLIKPDGGSVHYNGAEFSASHAYDIQTARSLAYVFQKPVMFNSSVYDNIAFGLKIRRRTKREVRSRVLEAAEWTGLTGLLKRKAVTLSGGEAGRVSLARVLALRPELLLLDEPTANLDPQSVLIIENLISKINAEFGTTILLVTHNMFQAKRLAQNAVLLIGGRIIERGKARELFENPADEQTKNFISGKMIY